MAQHVAATLDLVTQTMHPRKTINLLFGLLGLLLLALCGGMLSTLFRTEHDLAAEMQAETRRDALMHLTFALRNEERAALETLLGEDPPPASGPDLSPRQRTDAALADAARIFGQSNDGQAAPLLHSLSDAISFSRERLARLHDGQHPADPQTIEDWRRSLAPQTRNFERLALHLADHSVGPVSSASDLAPHAIANLRDLCTRLHRNLLDNRLRIETLAAGGPATPATLAALRATTSAALGALDEVKEHAVMAPRAATDPALQALDLLGDSYGPAEARLLDAFARGSTPDPATLHFWRDAARGAMQEFEHAERELSTAGHALFAQRIAQSRLALGAGTALTLASLALAIATFVILRRRLITPLDTIGPRLAALAPDPSGTPPADIGRAALSALDRIEMAEVARRHRHAEFTRLADHAVTENRHMLADLEAAARVQIAQLPTSPLALPGASFHALRHPSRIVAGDTFDCIIRPDGRSVTFQIDVAGHGAPAAIVSVAAHVAMKQALLSVPPDEPLATTIARVNAAWDEGLPYFTLLAVETDPATATARVVQCGHPALMRLPAEGGCETLGKGGLPIGVLPDATFDTITCPFRPGDRLILTTDGIVDAADPQGRPFGENRLRAMLTVRPQPDIPALFDRIERALWDWRGTDSPDDDVTILILESL